MSATQPDLQSRYGQHPDRAFNGNAPSLNVVDAAFGDGAGALWLVPQLFSVGEFAGVRERMDDVQALELARTIRADYGFLTITELMYFFHRFKAGCYGKFYGVVDPLVITTALHDHFLDERKRWLEKAENEERHRQEEREREERRGKTLTPQQVAELRARMERQWREQELNNQEEQ